MAVIVSMRCARGVVPHIGTLGAATPRIGTLGAATPRIGALGAAAPRIGSMTCNGSAILEWWRGLKWMRFMAEEAVAWKRRTDQE
jgi:hypothetical protein